MIKRLLILFLFVMNSAFSQQNGLQLGSMTLFPTVGFTYGYDDNVTYAYDEASKESSTFTVFSPGLRLERDGDRTDFLLQYDYNKTNFLSSSENNFEMHHALASLGYTPSSKSRFELSAEYFDGSDRRGTKNQQGNLLNLGLDPDEWHSFGIAGKWHYGGVGAKGSIDLAVGRINRQYDNNREYTITRDRETRYIEGTYGHRVSPKTRLLAQARLARIDYEYATLDNDEKRLMLGAEWDATGKTSVRALIGFLEKDFKDSTVEGFSGVAIEAGLSHRIRSYSVLDLTLTRETDETNGNGFYVVRNSADLGWTHNWKKRFSTTANVGYSSENYKGNVRDDDLFYYGLSGNYQFNDWLMTGFGYKHLERRSSFDEFEYEDNTVMLTLELSK